MSKTLITKDDVHDDEDVESTLKMQNDDEEWP